MNTNLLLPIAGFAEPSRPSELAILVREVLAENVPKLEGAITGGSMTIAVASGDHAIKFHDGCSGCIRFTIGGLARLSEIVPFEIDWEKRRLEMKISEMEEGSS